MRPEAMQRLWSVRGTMAKVQRACKVKLCTVSNWTYIPDRHLRAVSLALGVPQKSLPRKPEVEG